MVFNPDPNKQATSLEKDKMLTTLLSVLIITPVATASFQKHLGLILDEKLIFGHHLNEKDIQG